MTWKENTEPIRVRLINQIRNRGDPEETKKKERRKLTPHHSKPPHLYRLPKVHEESIQLSRISARNLAISDDSYFNQ